MGEETAEPTWGLAFALWAPEISMLGAYPMGPALVAVGIETSRRQFHRVPTHRLTWSSTHLRTRLNRHRRNPWLGV